ncbi:MAG: cytochrome P450, partial [Verrucomicrobiota bacterium]
MKTVHPTAQLNPKETDMIIDRKSLDELPVFKSHDSVEEASAAFLENPIKLLLAAYHECGPIFRMALGGEWKIILTGLESNDFIWRNPRLFSYGVGNKPFLEQMGHDHLTGLDGDHHKLKKKILKPAFSMAGAMRYLSIFNRIMSDKLDTLDPEVPTEMAELWARTIIDINRKTVAVCEIEDEMIELMSKWEFEFLRGLVLGEDRHEFFAREEYTSLKKQVFELFHRVLAERLDEGKIVEDNLNEVLKTRGEEEDPIDRDNAANDLYFILLAGVHNTAALIDSCIHFVYTRPEWLAALREELDAWDGEDL